MLWVLHVPDMKYGDNETIVFSFAYLSSACTCILTCTYATCFLHATVVAVSRSPMPWVCSTQVVWLFRLAWLTTCVLHTHHTREAFSSRINVGGGSLGKDGSVVERIMVMRALEYTIEQIRTNNRLYANLTGIDWVRLEKMSIVSPNTIAVKVGILRVCPYHNLAQEPLIETFVVYTAWYCIAWNFNYSNAMRLQQ